MSKMTIERLSEKMREIDFAMLFTRASDGALAGRPMSNNGEVEYKGDSFFFTWEQAHTVGDIEKDPNVGLSFAGAKSLLGKLPDDGEIKLA